MQSSEAQEELEELEHRKRPERHRFQEVARALVVLAIPIILAGSLGWYMYRDGQSDEKLEEANIALTNASLCETLQDQIEGQSIARNNPILEDVRILITEGAGSDEPTPKALQALEDLNNARPYEEFAAEQRRLTQALERSCPDIEDLLRQNSADLDTIEGLRRSVTESNRPFR